MKHLEVRLKYSTTRRIFNSLLSVSSSDETLRLMLDILLLTDPGEWLIGPEDRDTVQFFKFMYKMIARAIMAPANSR